MRKRKLTSPMKTVPEAKRPASSQTQASAALMLGRLQKETDRHQNVTSGHFSLQSGQPDESWEHISEGLGWSIADCLGHKLSFKKREDAKVIKDTLLTYVRRLRAAGWHLQTLKER